MSGDVEILCPDKECIILFRPGRRVTCCSASRTIVVWSKHDLSVHQLDVFPPKYISFKSAFCIEQVLLSNSIALCVDSNGAVHTLSIKGKSPISQRALIPFQPKAQGVLACCRLNDVFLSLAQTDLLSLNTHKFSLDFKIIKKHQLKLDNVKLDYRNTIMKCVQCRIDPRVSQNVFKRKSSSEEVGVVVFSSDGINVHGTIVDAGGKDTCEVGKLFKCSSDIADLHIVNGSELKIVIALKIGTIVCLTCSDKLETKIVHLNSTIHRIIMLERGDVLYTDGTSSHVTNLASDTATHKQIFIRQAKDFIKMNDEIVCITFSNLLYRFRINSHATIDTNEQNDGFVKVPTDLSSCKELVTEIQNEIKKNDQVLKKIKNENTSMLAVALSNNISILNQHIDLSARVYRSYEDVASSCDSITLTRPLDQYFDCNKMLLLLSLHVSSQLRHKFSELCASLPNSPQLHIDIACLEHDLATTVPLTHHLDSLNILIPFEIPRTRPKIEIKVKITSPIPSLIDKDKIFWAILYSTTRDLSAEHFIQSENKYRTTNKIKSTHEIVLDIAKKNHGAIYNFEITTEEKGNQDWFSYLAMSKESISTLGNKEMYSKTLNIRTSEYLSRKLGTTEFGSGSPVYLTVGRDHKVEFRLTHEEGVSVLTIGGTNTHVVCELKDFLSRVWRTRKPNRLVPHGLYAVVEDVRRRARDLLASPHPSRGDLTRVARHLHKDALATLPTPHR